MGNATGRCCDSCGYPDAAGALGPRAGKGGERQQREPISSDSRREVDVEELDTSIFTTLKVGPGGTIKVINLNLHDEKARNQELVMYYSLCRHLSGLHVTTSCFTTWRKNKKTNGHGKVIPTSKSVSSAHRVFFFDDNLDLDGEESSPGICNLRDAATGEFVEFTAGRNGFQRGHAGRHTQIHWSTVYNIVLVKANILDAIEDEDYFLHIVQAYAQPKEKLIIFMDVNSTIVCNDTVQSKDLSASLLSTMFELLELSPRSPPFDFGWGVCPPVKVEKRQTLKKLVKDITATDHEAYKSFFGEANCRSFYEGLASVADIRWGDGEKPLSVDEFVAMYEEYTAVMTGKVDRDGITTSWFRCFKSLKNEHTLILNSFGVDTRKVILATQPFETSVQQITVNYELWDKRDVEKFEHQFSSP